MGTLESSNFTKAKSRIGAMVVKLSKPLATSATQWDEKTRSRGKNLAAKAQAILSRMQLHRFTYLTLKGSTDKAANQLKVWTEGG